MSSGSAPADTSAPKAAADNAAPPQDANPERIALLADSLAKGMRHSLAEIGSINTTTRLLSINAQIEAARAGGMSGAAFAVVASAMQNLSANTAAVAEKMTTETDATIAELAQISKVLATNVRGTRLSDLALANIDVIDRNLYERSCDCRWWATDSSVVDALTQKSPDKLNFCSKRLGVILNAYTVYLDLVVCDSSGRVVANGRPHVYNSKGADCSQQAWFKSAMHSRSGDEFGFQSAHQSPLVNHQRVLIYSAGVREKGDAHGKLIGALGVVFNWDGLAQKVVESTPLSEAEKKVTRVCVIDKEGNVLADTHGKQLQERLESPDLQRLLAMKKGFLLTSLGGKQSCMAHALSPGFETYATGWHSVIIQQLGGK